MKRIALIKDGVVTNVIAHEDDYTPVAGEVDVTNQNVGPGFTYDGGSFTAPAAVTVLNALEFTRRFTTAERIAIRTAAKSSVAIEDFLKLLDIAAASGLMIHMNDPDVVAGVNAYESAGLIAAGRAAEILT